MPTSQIILSYAKQPKILAGHPWVYPKAIHEIKGTPEAGDWVEIYDSKFQRIGAGFYNPNSLYRVRIMADIPLLKQFTKWPDIVKHRLQKALLLRQTMGLPNEKNTAYRLFNSESDGLSGLVIDVFNQIVVISSNAYWTELYRDQILEILTELMPNHQTIWIGQSKTLKKDGWETPHHDDTAGLKTQVKEDGIIFEINFDHIQKTGIFIDQRENHHRLAELAKGKKVLDLYTYHGGFALHAAKAGAEKVTAVDSSKNAIIHAKHNAKLNNINNIEWIEGDAKDYIKTAGDYDIVILDPPKLIPSKRNIEAAKNLYRFLHRETFKHIKSGSILMTCNCSSALSTNEFTKLVAQQALAEHQSIQILGIYGPSICHPILPVFPEGQYLTALLIAVK